MTNSPYFRELDRLIEANRPRLRPYVRGYRRDRMAQLEARMREKYGYLRRKDAALRGWETRRARA